MSDRFQDSSVFNETLHIAKIQRTQGGRYYCKAENGLGSPAIKSIRVDVYCKCDEFESAQTIFIIQHCPKTIAHCCFTVIRLWLFCSRTLYFFLVSLASFCVCVFVCGCYYVFLPGFKEVQVRQTANGKLPRGVTISDCICVTLLRIDQ